MVNIDESVSSHALMQKTHFFILQKGHHQQKQERKISQMRIKSEKEDLFHLCVSICFGGSGKTDHMSEQWTKES